MNPENSLAGFELAWRWTDPKHDVLPRDALATIRPMSAPEARAFAAEAAARFEPAPVTNYDLSIVAEWDDAEAVRPLLEALPVHSETEIIVHWRPELAVRTLWSTFVRYWDSFCYPSSDDVTVWNPGQRWTLCYRHFQLIQFRASDPRAA